jgi:gliding motility-associated-like protein
VKDDFILRPSNILTPNADGFNDFWKVENIESYPEADIILYNRNGKVLQKFSNYNNRWDGKINGKPLATGTYYYIIQVRNKPTFSYKGFITIVNQ